MSNNTFCREDLGNGVAFSQVQDSKFRHNSISVYLIAPLDAKKASETAILPFIMRKSSSSFPDFTQLERELCDLYGASLSSDVVKYGDKHILCFSLTAIDDHYTIGGEVISDRCASLLGDMVLCPRLSEGAFDEQDFALEKQNLIDTIEAEINEKRTYAINQCRRMMFEGTELATPKYGTVEGAQALTAKAAAERYHEIIKSSQIEITFVGCGDPTAAKEKFRELFSNIERHVAGAQPLVLPAVPQAEKTATKVMEVAQGKLVMGMRTERLDSKDKIDAAKLMSALYGGTPSSKLFRNVREKLSLCYYCVARLDQPTESLMVDIGVEHANRDKAQAAILEQLKAIASGDFTESELHETKLAYANSIRASKDSLSATEMWYLMQILNGTSYTPDQEVEAILSVTAERVAKIAKTVQLDSVFFLTGEGKADE